MNIYEEFARLREDAKDPEKWTAIEIGWMQASNYQIRDGKWRQIGGSGMNVIGFAIDPVTWKFKIGKGCLESHRLPFEELLTELQLEAGSTDEFLDVERRLMEGRLASVDGYSYPLATFMRAIEWHVDDPALFALVEKKLVELGIGLPLSGLFIAHQVRKKGGNGSCSV